MVAMDRSLTPKEGIALDLIFALQGESRFNREQTALGTKYKYIRVALRAPKLAVLHADVNKILKKMAAAGYAPFEICSSKRTTATGGTTSSRPRSRAKQSARHGTNRACAGFNCNIGA
jgi:hypothetical protein